MLDKTLLFKAADAAQGISAAQTAIEDAKRAVEEAKASVETAKAGLVDAKAAYDSVIAEFVASGVPAAKVKRNVEDFLRILGDLGYVDPAEDAPATTEPKAPRRKKSEQSAPPADVVEGVAKLAEAGEPGLIVVGAEKVTAEEPAVAADPAPVDEPTTETAGEAVDDETTSTIGDAVPAEPGVADEAVHEQVKPPVEEAVEAPASDKESVSPEEVEAVSYDIDNSEAFSEILDLIETVCPKVHESVSEMLVTMLNAADWFSREWEKQPLDVQFYRDILNMEFVVSALKQPMSDELHAALGAVREAGNADEVFEWFVASLDAVESGAEPLPFSRRADAARRASTDGAVFPDVDAGDEVSSEDEYAGETVSDDVTLVGETVEDIGEINFLEEAAAAFAGATIETSSPAEPTKVPEEEAKPAAPRSFRPRFMSSKDA